MDCSLPGSSVHGILQTRILEWVGIPFSRRTSQPRVWNPGLLHCRFFTIQEVKCQTEKNIIFHLYMESEKPNVLSRCILTRLQMYASSKCYIKHYTKKKKKKNTIQYWTSPISIGLLLQLYIQFRISCQPHWLEIY